MGKRALVATLLSTASALVLSSQSAFAYTVQRGDDVYSISRRFGVPVQKIAQDNHLADPDRIYAGQQLIVTSGPAAAAPAPATAAGATYTVQPGDTLWKISRLSGVTLNRLATLNGITDPNHILAGQQLVLGEATPAPAAPATPTAVGHPTSNGSPVHGEQARRLLRAAAAEFRVPVNLMLAVSLWESGYNQAMVSPTGAVGMMQIEPYTAQWAGPALLGKQADINNPTDNARLGAALLRRYLDDLKDPKLALAAYYQGETATREHGIYPGSKNYVEGIYRLSRLLA